MTELSRRQVPEDVAPLVRSLPEETRSLMVELVNGGPDPAGAWQRMAPLIEAHPTRFTDPLGVRKICALVASSRALARALYEHPYLLEGPDPKMSVPLQLQAALIDIAGDDLAGLIELSAATKRFSDTIDRLVEDALLAVRADLSERRPLAGNLPFTVIAMGKWGGRELNYSSDIDLIFVHDNVTDQETESRTTALAMASRLMAHLSASTFDGAGPRVDADLRPEGGRGPLSRSLDGYRAYYGRWAEGWELQALIKARVAAGDQRLGGRFMEIARDHLWDQGLEPDSLRSIRLVKQQGEGQAPVSDIKRSRGGIRDIEFSVQLLQLVHGRHDPELRSPTTIAALAALAHGGYIAPEEHQLLHDGYVFLRDLEHRIQLWDLRQTHQLPDSPVERARIGKALGLGPVPEEALLSRLAEVRATVRDTHEQLYFRPILDVLVGSPSARLGIDMAEARLEALGFSDVRAAGNALSDLTAGISRRARVMHQILPLMLDWLSLSPDPDLGLAQLRNVLAHTPDHSMLVSLLQTNPLAGERLCRLLGTGRLLGDLIDRIPEFVPRLADDRLVGQIRDAGAATERLIGLLDARPDLEARVGTIRRFVRRRKLRIAARDVLNDEPVRSTLLALSDGADAAMRGSVHVVDDATGFCVIAMGKWGGRELSYSSDLDLLHVFAYESDRQRGTEIAARLRHILSDPSKYGDAYVLDTELRPEGRSGPVARSLDAYRSYYSRWAEPWEILALTRARPVAGDGEVGRSFLEIVEPIVWRERQQAKVIQSVRNIKARVESERIPANEDPDYHLKLGPGGLSDVEFLTQLLQLMHGGRDPSLRVTGTLEAVERLEGAGILTAAEAKALNDSYEFCSKVRLRLHLQTGRVADSLPLDTGELAKLSTSLGLHRPAELRDSYRRVTRRARRVFEARFYS